MLKLIIWLIAGVGLVLYTQDMVNKEIAPNYFTLLVIIFMLIGTAIGFFWDKHKTDKGE